MQIAHIIDYYKQNLTRYFGKLPGSPRKTADRRFVRVTKQLREWSSATGLKAPILRMHERETGPKGWLVIADFDDCGYTPGHHHLAMQLALRGVCVWYRPE